MTLIERPPTPLASTPGSSPRVDHYNRVSGLREEGDALEKDDLYLINDFL